jgi:hypothetical protein
VGVTVSPPSSVSLAVVVQHHPSRARLLDPLLLALGDCDVVADPEPNGRRSAIRCYLACLRAMPPWASHLLIVQDDARPSRGWRALADEAIAEKPDALIVLFLAGAPHKSAALARLAHGLGERWIRMPNDDWTPTVATIWPRARIAEFLAWRDGYLEPVGIGDDNLVGEFTKRCVVPVWATVPSVIDHPNIEPSLVGKQAGSEIRLRTAAVPPVL